VRYNDPCHWFSPREVSKREEIEKTKKKEEGDMSVPGRRLKIWEKKMKMKKKEEEKVGVDKPRFRMWKKPIREKEKEEE
jgi:hypothetical protein